MIVRPFPALRPATSDLAARIACPPYDVMDTEEARAMAAGNPKFFLRVIRPEIDLAPDADPSADSTYAHAGEVFAGLQKDGSLTREAAPSLYLYRQTMGEHVQTAVVACCATDEYRNGTILQHEKTRKDKEDDRTRHIRAIRAQTGQVFLCYKDRAEIDGIVARETASAPIYDFTSSDGIRHTVWKVAATEALAEAFKAVPKAYIADGHHRSAAAVRVSSQLREEGVPAGNEADFFMACLFPASQLRILPYNRCVRDLNGMTPEEFLKAAMARGFSAAAIPVPENLPDHSCAVRLPSGWYRLSWSLTDAQAADPVARLDVSRLQEDLLAPVLGIGDPRTDKRIYFVGGIRGTGELERDVASGKAAVAFAMNPTTIDQMMAIADAGDTMPPKSTWFEPKLRSGLLIHTF